MARERNELRQALSMAGSSEGRSTLVKAVRARLWSGSSSFGLAADLSDLPEPRRARIPVTMEVHAPRQFKGFDEELERVSGGDAIEVANRIRMCRAGVERLYVATDPEGEAIYAQWLIDRSSQGPLHEVVPKMFPDLGPDETLVEGAYTFVNFRRTGAMADGMNQLLVDAAKAGAKRCFTYVAEGNAPSLKGCARVGFGLDHVRVTQRRLGTRSVVRRPPEPADQQFWDDAVAPSEKK